MKLVQINVWQGRIIIHLMKLLDVLQPDIICMQEVMSAEEKVVTPERLFNSLELLQEATKLPHVYFSPTFSAVYSGVRSSFGNAILSRFPLSDKQTIFTGGQYIPDYKPSNFDVNLRNMQIVKVTANSQTFHLVNHHGHWLTDPMGDETSLERMKIVKREMEKITGPFILSGDLNLRPESKPMALFNGWLTNLTRTHKIVTTLSPIAKVPNVPCDYILISPGITAKHFEVRDEIVSDHRALVFEFDI